MKLRNLFAIFSIVLIVATVLVGSCFAQNERAGNIKIKGEVLHDASMDIYIYSIENGVWDEVSIKRNRWHYNVKIDTDKTYKIVFISSADNKSKTLTIKKGKAMRYFQHLDIDFQTKDKFACLYQNDKYDYILMKSSSPNLGAISSVK